MKRFFILIGIILITAINVSGQNQLSTGKFFDENSPIISRPDTHLIYMSKDAVKSRNLSLYQSISFVATSRELQELEQCLNKDIKRAKSKQVKKWSGRTTYCFLYFGQKGNEHQYLLYRNKTPQQKNKTEVTLIYIEGKENPTKLQQQFRPKK